MRSIRISSKKVRMAKKCIKKGELLLVTAQEGIEDYAVVAVLRAKVVIRLKIFERMYIETFNHWCAENFADWLVNIEAAEKVVYTEICIEKRHKSGLGSVTRVAD